MLNDRKQGDAGQPLLCVARTGPAPVDFPGAAGFSANLGLHCILKGLDDEGIRSLHEAEARLETEGRSGQLVDALDNEAACLRFDKKQQEANAVQSRADALRSAYRPEPPASRHASEPQHRFIKGLDGEPWPIARPAASSEYRKQARVGLA